MFGPGGAERVLSILANQWAASGMRVTALAVGDIGQEPFFPFSEDVTVGTLALQGISSNTLIGAARTFVRVRALQKALRNSKPDVVISFLDRTNILTLLATRSLGVPVIISERTDPAGRNIGRAWELLRQVTYPWADCLVCQGKRPLHYFPERLRRRGVIIPNPVILPAGLARLPLGLGRQRPQRMVVALGSLRMEKGFDLLLEAFTRVATQNPQWSLTIWGEGPSRSALQAQARALGIERRVRLPGITREPFARLAEADLFVLSSRVEGFPNALTEAMSVGLPVIATDVGAVPEIVRHGVDGLVVPPGDVNALAAEIGRLMGNERERSRLATHAPEVLERFSCEKVMGMWDMLIPGVELLRSDRRLRNYDPARDS